MPNFAGGGRAVDRELDNRNRENRDGGFSVPKEGLVGVPPKSKPKKTSVPRDRDPGKWFLPEKVNPTLLAPPPPPVIPAVQAEIDARKKQRMDAAKRRGRASTILTSGAGVVGSARLSRPQALGG